MRRNIEEAHMRSSATHGGMPHSLSFIEALHEGFVICGNVNFGVWLMVKMYVRLT